MPAIRRFGVFSAVFLTILALHPGPGRGAALGPQVRVVAESGSGLTLHITLPEPTREEVRLDGASYLSVGIPGFLPGSNAPAGSPDLPRHGFPFGLPEGTHARIARVTVVSSTSFDGAAPLPVPERRIIQSDPLPSQESRYAADPAVYASHQLFPAETAGLGPVQGFRHQRVQSLIVRPVQVVPATGHYEVVRELEVEVRFDSDPSAPGMGRRVSVPTDAPGWDESYDRILVNPTSARSFRSRPVPQAEAAAVGPGDTYIRLRLGGSGLCRVPYADLETAGWPAGVPVTDVRVEERGYDKTLANPFTIVSLPRRVEDVNGNGTFDAGDFLVFYGLNYEDRFHPSITDSRYSYFHTYWVTPSNGPGRDMAVVDGFPPDTGFVALTAFLQTQHFEQNSFYINNPKDTLPYLFPIYDALYWLQLKDSTSPPSSKVVDLSFSIGDLAPGGTFRIRARWQGVNTTGDPGTHVVALDLNGQPELPEGPATTFCRLEPFLWEGPVEPMAGKLNSGQNRLTVKAHASNIFCGYSTSTNAFSGCVFDWFEVIYDRLLVARNDQLLFNTGTSSGPLSLSVSGFSSPDILVLDVTDPVNSFLLTPSVANVSGSYTATIRVAVTPGHPRSFLAVVPASVLGLPPSLHPLPPDLGPKAIDRGLSRDLLADGDGSDYILITHPDFRQAWQPLVDHRESVGHTVFLCDVWEIYDQFSGGDKTPWAIQRFLLQAFRNWDPSPSFVLLGGDANEDYRNDTPDSNPDWVPTMMHFGAVYGAAGNELAGTDSWYVQFLRPGDPEYDVLPDMHLARVPAGSVTEVSDFVQKILNYETMSPGDDWRRRGVFLADDHYSSGISGVDTYCWQPGEQAFQATSAAMVDSIHALAGLHSFQADTLFLADYLDTVSTLGRHPPNDCPNALFKVATSQYTRKYVTPVLLDSLSRGCLIWEFSGHANKSAMTHEDLIRHDTLSLHDIDKVLNFGKPFLFMGYACHLMEFEFAGEGTAAQDAIGEALLMAPNRGAIGVFASTCFEWLTTNPYAQIYTTRPLFWNLPRDVSGRPRRLWGEAITRGIVQMVLENPEGFGILDMPRTYQPFGDPALRIDISQGTWSALTVNGSPWPAGQPLVAQSFTDTLSVHATVEDDVDISSIGVLEAPPSGSPSPLPSSLITVTPPSPTQEGVQPYQVQVRTPLRLGTYDVRLEATDWTGRPASLDLPVVFQTNFDADGTPVGNGETVDPNAVIGITVSSPVPLAASNFQVKLDGTVLPSIVPTGGPNQWQLKVTGPWSAGTHQVELTTSDPNASCVPGPCPLVRGLSFQSAGPGGKLSLEQVYFYPNPVEADEGALVYKLNQNATGAQVSIYSLSGRRVRRDTSPTRAGLNSYRWDLRDEAGDRVANGVYLFVLRLEGANGEVITTASRPERVAITR
jgi:peptidase C25-like protein/flagellar hook capping protein FlgD